MGISVVVALAGVVELAGSIGCLRRAEWGRALLVKWAIGYPVLVLLTTLVSVAYIIPRTLAHTPPAPNVPPGFVAAMAYGGAALGLVLRLIFPAFVLAYLRRPAVRAVFQ